MHDLGIVSTANMNVETGDRDGAGDLDWVPFRVTLGRIGRRQSRSLTGPSGFDEDLFTHGVAYSMEIHGGLQLGSPETLVDSPRFVLPPPMKTGPDNLTLILQGAAEVRNAGAPSQLNEVGVYSQFPDTLLHRAQVTIAHPAGVWDGLLTSYRTEVTLFRDANGHIAGNQGTSGKVLALVYQQLLDPSALFNPRSTAIQVP